MASSGSRLFFPSTEKPTSQKATVYYLPQYIDIPTHITGVRKEPRQQQSSRRTFLRVQRVVGSRREELKNGSRSIASEDANPSSSQAVVSGKVTCGEGGGVGPPTAAAF